MKYKIEGNITSYKQFKYYFTVAVILRNKISVGVKPISIQISFLYKYI